MTRVFVVSAPSGTGKGTLISSVREQYCKKFGRDLVLSVSYTTRPPREGEQEGVQYHFVSVEEFKAIEHDKGFYETAPFSDRWYGTPRRYVLEAQRLGLDVLLEIEVKGARKLKRNSEFPSFTSVFVVPPDRNEQIRRLLDRKQNNPKDLHNRVSEAPEEIRNYRMYDHLIVNEHGRSEEAAAKLFRIVEGVEPRPEPSTIRRRVAAILATYNRRKDLNPNHG